MVFILNLDDLHDLFLITYFHSDIIIGNIVAPSMRKPPSFAKRVRSLIHKVVEGIRINIVLVLNLEDCHGLFILIKFHGHFIIGDIIIGINLL